MFKIKIYMSVLINSGRYISLSNDLLFDWFYFRTLIYFFEIIQKNVIYILSRGSRFLFFNE